MEKLNRSIIIFSEEVSYTGTTNRDNAYRTGLDIGCGTGHSAIALTEYCSSVIGFEPSPDMISKAIYHPNVKYLKYDKNKLVFADNTFNVITLAGPLFYAKSQILLDEVVRVSKDTPIVIIYDFKICITDIYSKLDIRTQIENTNYDYTIDFSVLDSKKLNRLTSSE